MRTQIEHLLLAFVLWSATAPGHAQGTAFTYQGRLNDGPTPANGVYDLQFTVYDGETEGSAVGRPITQRSTPVSNGLFTVTLTSVTTRSPAVSGGWRSPSVLSVPSSSRP